MPRVFLPLKTVYSDRKDFMIRSITGVLAEKNTDSAVLETGGVGFFIQIPTSVAAILPDEGETVTLYTYLSVREDSLDLYGFADKAGLKCFRLLTGVSGVGPKMGLAVLSVLSPRDVALAAAGGDYKAFTAASGVGTKLAQRIVLELKGKFTDADMGADFGAISNRQSEGSQAVNALVALGYSQSQAVLAVSKVDGSQDIQEIIKQSLKLLAGGKIR